jgi:hypothetical protein
MTRASGTAGQLGAIASEPWYDRLIHALAGVPDGLAAAYRDALSDRRLAWASPAVFTVGSYVGLYGFGLTLLAPAPWLPVMTFAVAIGLIGLLAGIGFGWRAVSQSPRLRPVDRSLLTTYALLLLGVGLAALVAYFVAIGYIPLFQPDLEQSRVNAAEEGGAPLRVLSMLALPGVWILVAQAAAARDGRRLFVAVLAVAVVAIGFTLTGNRSPAFQAVEVALIAGLLAAGKDRFGGRGVAILAVVGIAFVIGAGVFGAFRLASRGEVYGPPVPGAQVRAPDFARLTAIAIKGYLIVPINNLEFTLEAVPDRIGWRFGLTYLQPVLTMLPGRQTTFDGDLKAALDQRYAGGGTVPGLIGEAHANFGPVGWLLVPFLAGAAITALYRVAQAGSPELAALYGYAIAHVSIGGVLSGLSMASIFPFEAYAALGFAVVGLPIVQGRLARAGVKATA